MKITHLCLAGTITDGWSYQENILAKFHRKLGYDVDLITSIWVYDSNNKMYQFPKMDYELDDGVHVIRLSVYKGKKFSSRLKRYEGVLESLIKSNPDVLFIHGCQFRDISTIIKYLKRNSNVTTYVDNHADFSNSAKTWLSKNILHKVIWRHYAKMINPFVKKWYGVLPARVDFLKKIYGLSADKVEFLPLGADDDLVEKYSSKEIRFEYRKKYGIPDDDILLVTGGKIDLAKKQTLLLMEAVNQIDNPKLKLIVFGSVVSQLKDDIEKRCSAKVKYVGWLSSEESYPYFAMADLVVFPGRHSVFWEQVAGQGIPMVVKYWPGTTHIDLDGNVKFLYKDSVEEISDVLKETTDLKVLKEMAEIACEKRSLFLYSRIAKECMCYNKTK